MKIQAAVRNKLEVLLALEARQQEKETEKEMEKEKTTARKKTKSS